jgi:hypothetical protein
VRDKNGANGKKFGSLKESVNLSCETKFAN